MSQTPKQIREIEAHNRLAQEHYRHLADDVFQPDALIQALLEKAGDLAGKKVLECGCGRGLFTQYLAGQGAFVTAFDISDKMVELGRERLQGHPNAEFKVGAIEVLALDPESYDLILGLDILHHIDLKTAMPKLREWLKPGGRALFVENLGYNPILAWSRKLLAGRLGVAKYGTDDERPLSRSDVRTIQKSFGQIELYIPEMVFFQIFSRNVLRYQHCKWLQQGFIQLDQWLFKHFPRYRWLSYKAVVIIQGRGVWGEGTDPQLI